MFIYIDKLYIEIKVISDICLIGFVDDFYFKEFDFADLFRNLFIAVMERVF